MLRRRDNEQGGAPTPAPDRAPTAAPAPTPAERRPLLPYYPPRGYLGQLEPAHQEALSKLREGADLSDFTWYHATELPDGRVLPGAWDLRGHEADYLGGVDLAGTACSSSGRPPGT